MEIERLYEADPYIREFDARVVACEQVKDHYRILLDRTAFFPEGGGQPGDRGMIGEALIKDTHEKDGMIWHYSDRGLNPGNEVHGKIDWDFRFSNMQNHAGEHIVSGLIHGKYGYDNVGFHMGSEAVTLDINGELTKEQVKEIEKEANAVIEANIPIQVFIPEKRVLEQMEYRSKKELEGDVRIVEISGYDRCACCGTHPLRTGEIRLIKILFVQNYKGGVRIAMLSGNRALEDYMDKHESVVDISHLLSAKTGEITGAVERLLKEMADLKYTMVQMKRELMERKAKTLEISGNVVCVEENEFKGNELREYANMLSERVEKVLVVSGGTDSQRRYVLIDKRGGAKTLGQEIQTLFGGKGGGSPQMIQGTMSGNFEEIKRWFEQHA
ncbi:MAG: alanyl-tRNA editing protein [Frisingicoccus sp.]|uniref:alanyl-tRNA editing protein n=1 Tax=Frisingicoccus sp. TaxID=1918627 RepID=UPI002A833D4B|nr:alanyl-tRNA editing protein [Frisingicoccus sp.]MDY4835763.1 alanyl-tRNA editing protein [Frisingicoccus sp.]